MRDAGSAEFCVDEAAERPLPERVEVGAVLVLAGAVMVGPGPVDTVAKVPFVVREGCEADVDAADADGWSADRPDDPTRDVALEPDAAADPAGSWPPLAVDVQPARTIATQAARVSSRAW